MKPVKKNVLFTNANKSLLYLTDLKLNFIVFLKSGFKYKQNSQLVFEKISLQELINYMPSKILFVSKKTQGHLVICAPKL